MRILFLTDNFPPETNAPASRTFDHVSRWIERGASVTVVTCAPNFPSGQVFSGYRNKPYQIERYNRIRVVRVWSYIVRNAGLLKRIADYTSYAITATVASLFEPCDLIVATSPQFFTAIAGAVVGFVRRKPWVFELRDLWPESIRAVGAMKSRIVYQFLETLELFLYRRSRMVIAVTHSFKTNLISRGISGNKIHVVPNGANPTALLASEDGRSLRRDLGISGYALVVGYVGTIGMAHGLQFIAACASERPEIEFVIVGSGAERDSLGRYLRENGIGNVHLFDPVPKHEVPRYLTMFDYSLVCLRRADTFRTVIPSKIFESAAIRRPMILGVEGEAQRIIDNYGAGISYTPEDRASYLSAIDRARDVTGSETYRDMQRGCDRLARDFDRNKLADKMLSLLRERLVGG